MEHPNPSQPNTGPRADESPYTCINFSTAKKKLHQVKVSRRSLGTISTVAMLDSFVLKTISGLDVKILLSYIKYVSKFAIVYLLNFFINAIKND